MILLDTGVVSAVLRRRRRGEIEEQVVEALGTLLDSDEAVALPGIVFQEVLSGIHDRRQERRVLRGIRDSFPVVLADEEDHQRAARLASDAAARGIAASTPDTLIASQAIGLGCGLMTVDPDFTYLASLSDLKVLYLGKPSRS